MSPEQTERPAHRFAEGLAQYRAGAKDAALAYFQRAARDHTDDAEACYFLGLILFKLGRHPEAIGPLRRSADLVPAEDALVKLALAQGQTRDMDGCLATLQEAARKLPGSAEVRAYLGTTLRTLDRLEEALEAYRAALALNPEHVPALWGMGVALGMMERPGEGMAALKRAIQLEPAFPPPHFHLGVLAWVTGDLEEMRRQETILQGLATSYADRLHAISATEGSPHV